MSKKQPDPFIFLGTPSSISWSLWLLTLPLSFVLTFAFMPSGPEGHLVALCVIAVIAHLATGLVLYIGRTLLLSDFNRFRAKFLMVIVFMLSGVARGITVGQLTVAMNIEKDPHFTYRITSSIVTLVFTFVLLSTLISNGMNNRIESDQLRAYIGNLNQLKTESKAQILGIREKVQDEIRRILTSNLSQVTSEDQITLISEKMIRPLGHQLFLNTFKPIDFPKYLPSRTRLNFNDLAVLLKDLIVSQPFNILIVAMAELFIPLTLKIYTLGIGIDLLLSITPIIIPLSILSLAKYVQNKRLSDGRSGFSLPWILAIWFAAALGSALISNSIPIFHTYIPNPALYAFLQLSVFITISALFYGLSTEQLKIRRSLATTSDSLRIQEQSIKRQVAIEEKRLGKIIHGEVQARLILLASQISKNVSNSHRPEPGFVIEVENILNEAFKQIQESLDSTYFPDSFEKLIKLWEPVLDIQTKLQPDATYLLQTDPLITVSIIEIIAEALSNAFRHGSASHVTIEIISDTAKSISIRVTDNGTLNVGASKGMGSKLISELSNSWQLVSIDGNTQLNARIELAP